MYSCCVCVCVCAQGHTDAGSDVKTGRNQAADWLQDTPLVRSTWSALGTAGVAEDLSSRLKHQTILISVTVSMTTWICSTQHTHTTHTTHTQCTHTTWVSSATQLGEGEPTLL